MSKIKFCMHFFFQKENEINELIYQLLLNKKGNIKKDLGHTKTMFTNCDFVGTPSVEGKQCME